MLTSLPAWVYNTPSASARWSSQPRWKSQWCETARLGFALPEVVSAVSPDWVMTTVISSGPNSELRYSIVVVVHIHGQVHQLLNHVLPNHAGMAAGARGNDVMRRRVRRSSIENGYLPADRSFLSNMRGKIVSRRPCGCSKILFDNIWRKSGCRSRSTMIPANPRAVSLSFRSNCKEVAAQAVRGRRCYNRHVSLSAAKACVGRMFTCSSG